jgi:hypothetical protein
MSKKTIRINRSIYFTIINAQRGKLLDKRPKFQYYLDMPGCSPYTYSRREQCFLKKDNT